MACNLVTNFEVALIMTLWQCSVFGRTIPWVREGTATRKLVCHAFLSIAFTFSGYSRSVEACNCCSERRETRTQIGQRGKTENRIRVIKSENPLVFFAKTENQMLKDRKSTNHNEHQNRKTKVFKQKKRKTDLKKSQNRKTKNSNAPLLFLRD